MECLYHVNGCFTVTNHLLHYMGGMLSMRIPDGVKEMKWFGA